MPKQAARRYPYAYLAVFDTVASAIPHAGGKYQVVSADAASGLITISASMNLLTWGENLAVTVRSETDEWTRVDVVVAMKMGLIDWGQRARDIRDLFGAIDRSLPGGQPVDAESARMTQVPVPHVPSPQVPPPAGWHPDPMRRHEHRYWDGHAWSEHVANGGQTSTDPIA